MRALIEKITATKEDYALDGALFLEEQADTIRAMVKRGDYKRVVKLFEETAKAAKEVASDVRKKNES